MTVTSLKLQAKRIDQDSRSRSIYKYKEMPTTTCHQMSPSSAMTSSFRLTANHLQNTTPIDGFFQSKDLNLARHIEALKSAANGPIVFPNVNNNAGHPATSLLSIANSGEYTDLSPLRNRPHSSNWAIDPSTVPGNLRKRSVDKNEAGLTVEEILSRGSSVSEKASENEDGLHVSKSRVKARRKLGKTHKRKSETISHKLSESPLARSALLNTQLKLNRGTNHHHPTSVESHTDVDALTALCKGITIQEKVANPVNVKLASFNARKELNTQTFQHSRPNAKATVPTLNIRKLVTSSSSDSKKTVPVQTVHHPQRKKSLSKTEEIKTVKVFQSDQQSGVISDLGLAIPCAPPATPTAEHLRKFEYVPSLQDVRAQRAFRQRLHAMEVKESQKEMRKQESLMAVEKLSLKEKRQQLKKMQRQQIYALNKVMTELEHERFHTFMQGVGTGIS
ncbi:hypothetical protein EGW08_007565 [Elysia chlorotica]|uniref:Small vasohibin-binding protein n=1 Tax=Elysia chlorotica TaxID=188477 RepID=A0A3S1C6Y9_ELYCH|nr:hypothetical protein EGW08_007565 [Elysia chlorotica]